MAPVAEAWRLGVASLAGDLSTAVAAPAREDALDDDPALVDYARLCGRDPEVDRLGLTAFASHFLGRDQDALLRAERAVQWADSRADARSKIWALFMLCMLHDLRCDWKALKELAPAVDEAAARHQVTPWLGVGMALSTWASSREKNEPVFPAGLFGSILRDRGHSSNVSLRTMLFLLSSRIFARAGDLAEAETSARDGLGCCERTDERHMEPELRLQLARVLAARGERSAAAAARRQALAAARSHGNVLSELHTLADCIEAEEAAAPDVERLRALGNELGPNLGPHERALLDRLATG